MRVIVLAILLALSAPTMAKDAVPHLDKFIQNNCGDIQLESDGHVTLMDPKSIQKVDYTHDSQGGYNIVFHLKDGNRLDFKMLFKPMVDAIMQQVCY